MQDDERLDLRSVCRFFGGTKPLHPATVYRNIKAGRFPKPVKIAGSSRWLRSECQACLQQMVEGGGSMSKLPSPNDIKLINAAHQSIVAAYQGALEKAIECGEMLRAAKDKVGHGNWTEWLTTNCPDIKERTASHYMYLAGKATDLEKAAEQNGTTLADLSIGGAKRLLPKKPATEKQKAAAENRNAAKSAVPKPVPASPDLTSMLQNVDVDEVLGALKQAGWELNKLNQLAAALDQYVELTKTKSGEAQPTMQ
jgi:predicted DNA-binding transcriptional regulator AlpA